MADNPAGQVTGDDLISELIRNVDAGLFKVGHTVLLPCRFNVYLYADDFALITAVAQVVRGEAKQALTEHLQLLNEVRVPPPLVRRLGLAKQNKKAKYKILEPDWSIDFHRGEEDRLGPGEIEIYSDLGSEPAMELGSGAKTTFVTRHAAGETYVRPTQKVGDPGPEVFATLRYRDSGGEKVFAMTREEIVIGRGGKAVWADLKLEGPPDISREHCRIRRDVSSGRFFLKDLSQFGTAVNGVAVTPSIDRSAQSGAAERDLETALPPAAKITLADVLVIEFEAKQPE